MIPMNSPADLVRLKGMHISLAMLIRFCRDEYGMSEADAETKARAEAKAAGVVLIEDKKPCG